MIDVIGPEGVSAYLTPYAGKAIRVVALGVIGAAIIQAVLAGLGLTLSGVPALGILTVLVFIVCLAQLGPMPLLVPAVVWLFRKDQSGWGGALGACSDAARKTPADPQRGSLSRTLLLYSDNSLSDAKGAMW